MFYKNQKKFLIFLVLIPMIFIQFNCPHKPIDPGTLATKSAELFSLPAPVTSGSLEFKPQMYLTSGVYQLETYDKTGYDGRKYTFNYVGAQIQFMSFKKSNGTIGYKPKWVISGGYSQDDINNKKNILIISIMPVFDTALSTDVSYECDNASDTKATNFCDNILGSGKPFASYNESDQTDGLGKDFYSYESETYSICSNTNGEVIPYDPDNLGLDPDTSQSDCVKDYWYHGTDVDPKKKGKKYNVVIEFIDNEGNIYTSKFPYNNDLDNQGNHTTANLIIKNLPDPSKDPDNFASSEIDKNKNIWTHITAPTNNQTVNCTGLQKTAASQTINCSEIIAKINLTIANNTTPSKNVDDDIIHKMQLAGKEFRALGSDTDPRYEFMINDIFFNVKRGPNLFIEEDK